MKEKEYRSYQVKAFTIHNLDYGVIGEVVREFERAIYANGGLTHDGIVTHQVGTGKVEEDAFDSLAVR